MPPHSFTTTTLGMNLTPGQKRAAGGWAARHGKFAKGAVLPETQVPACPRVKVSELPEGFLPQRWIDGLEQNQLIASCCRHPENHEIEAVKSHPEEMAPDIYIFHCKCKRKHRRFCVGMTDERPSWSA